MEHVNQTLTYTASAEHPVTLLVAVMYAVSVLIWNGDLDEADEQIGRFISNARTYALNSHVILGRCFRGQLAISRGDHEAGLELLQSNLNELRALRYELLTTSFNISLVQALAATGRFAEGTALVDEAIQLVEMRGDYCYMPELLRVKANLLFALPQPLEDAAEDCLRESIAVSRRQGAVAWELRTSIDWAKLWNAQQRPERAKALLQPVVDRFSGAFKTADLRVAEALLASWR
jgi:predicted ATPase